MKLNSVYIDINGILSAFDGKGKEEQDCSGYIFDNKVKENLKRYCDKDTNFHFTLGGNYAMQIPLALLAIELQKDTAGQDKNPGKFVETAA